MATYAATQTVEIIQNSNLSKYSKTVKSTKDESDESSFAKILLSTKENDKNNKLLEDTKDENDEIKFIKLQNDESKNTKLLNNLTKDQNTKNNKLNFLKKLSFESINISTKHIKNEFEDSIDIKKELLDSKDSQNKKIDLIVNENQSNSETILENKSLLSLNNKTNLPSNNDDIENIISNEIDTKEINLNPDNTINDQDEKVYSDKDNIKEISNSNIKLSTLLSNNFEKNENKIEKSNLENREKELKQQNYISRTFLSKTENLVKNEHEIKQAKTLNEVINTAKKHDLNPQKIEIETKKQEETTPTKLNIQSHTAINSAKAILNSHPHISQHVAALNIEIDENKKNIDKKTSTSLQELLKKSNTDNKNNVLQTSVTKSSNAEQEIDLSKIFNQLQQNSSKSHQKENISTSITSKLKDSKQKNITNSGVEKTFTKVDLNEMIHSDNINKNSEQISQRIIDAKQTIRHFAQTLQEQVENYKPPFTRMQLSLDPKDLGKVEVTLISRGNNLHIQVNSNPTAIGVMAVQGNELRNQLTSMGFTDVQMQFNMNQQQQQQQQQNSRRQMYSGNEYIDIDEIPENYESLEIIIPQYV